MWEWNDTVFDITDPGTGDLEGYARGLRGDAWNSPPNYIMSSSFQYSNDQMAGYGFRVASVVPEPTSAALLLGSGAMLLLRRRRAAAL